MIQPNDPALPTLNYDTLSDGTPIHYTDKSGISIRAELAARAMQGILSNGSLFYADDPEEMAFKAVKCADALIEELNKTK